MDEQEIERQKYIRLRNRLQTIKSNIESLQSSKNELLSLLNNSFKINNEIVEKDKLDDISNNIVEGLDSINQTISIANRKI